MPATTASPESNGTSSRYAHTLESIPPQRADAPPIQRRKNSTGLPDRLKAGIERLGRIPMDDVKVHYNSAEPARVGAAAHTRGTTIHIAPGQEGYLPHEAWHVVQQKQRRVKPTSKVAGQPLNDDAGLEREADIMGKRAMSGTHAPASTPGPDAAPTGTGAPGIESGGVMQRGKINNSTSPRKKRNRTVKTRPIKKKKTSSKKKTDTKNTGGTTSKTKKSGTKTGGTTKTTNTKSTTTKKKSTNTKSTVNTKKKPVKRKQDDEDDDDYKPVKKRKTTVTKRKTTKKKKTDTPKKSSKKKDKQDDDSGSDEPKEPTFDEFMKPFENSKLSTKAKRQDSGFQYLIKDGTLEERQKMFGLLTGKSQKDNRKSLTKNVRFGGLNELLRTSDTPDALIRSIDMQKGVKKNQLTKSGKSESWLDYQRKTSGPTENFIFKNTSLSKKSKKKKYIQDSHVNALMEEGGTKSVGDTSYPYHNSPTKKSLRSNFEKSTRILSLARRNYKLHDDLLVSEPEDVLKVPSKDRSSQTFKTKKGEELSFDNPKHLKRIALISAMRAWKERTRQYKYMSNLEPTGDESEDEPTKPKYMVDSDEDSESDKHFKLDSSEEDDNAMSDVDDD